MSVSFSVGDSEAGKWRLDVIGILAILGERNVKLSSNLILSTRLCYLPRLLPAPQALLSGKRIKKLPVEEGFIVQGIFNGLKAKGLNYFATLLHRDYLEDRAYVVRRLELRPRKHDHSEIQIPRILWSPVNMITIASCIISVALFFFAGWMRDGVGALAIAVMSITTTLICAANHWKPRLPNRSAPRSSDDLPKGDVVIRSEQGSFLVVHCEDTIARKLYFNQEDCEYSMSASAATAMGGFAGGFGIIVAVILFTNCSWPIQVATAIAYAILNLAYWIVAICRPTWTWDFSDFDVIASAPETRTNFTGALAAAIQIAGSVHWAFDSDAAPKTAAWKRWLDRAQECLHMNNDAWFMDRSNEPDAPVDLSHFQATLTYYLKHPQEV